MDILFEVTSEGAAAVLLPLTSACDRAGVSWGCFFTGDGVLSLANKDVVGMVKTADSAITCEVSWQLYMGGRECPVELGSQTNNSTFVGEADKVISL